MATRGRSSIHVGAPPDAVFAVITDLPGLPSWNSRMTGVVELPPELRPGAEWVVSFAIAGARFTSRSHVIELDGRSHRFVYRSKREDNNPSFTIWGWKVDPEGDGSKVTLEWEMRPATLFRKKVVGPLRGRQIERSDVPASLTALRQEVVRRGQGRPAQAPSSPSSSSGEG
ncbi:MAG: SRPBCC family protein [Acidimicrobiia bacterium]